MTEWLRMAQAARQAREGAFAETIPRAEIAKIAEIQNGGVSAINAISAKGGITAIDLTEDQRERFEERAAIMEYDGGMTQQEAERLALVHVLGLRRPARSAG